MCTRRAHIRRLRGFIIVIFCVAMMNGAVRAQSDGAENVIVPLKKITGCKSYTLEPIILPNPNKQDVTIMRNVVGGRPGGGVAMLQLHGNIAYTFDYRARLD